MLRHYHLKLFSGRTPYDEIKNELTVSMRILQHVRPQRPSEGLELGLSDDIWDVVSMTWDASPEERPSLASLTAALDWLSVPWEKGKLDIIVTMELADTAF